MTRGGRVAVADFARIAARAIIAIVAIAVIAVIAAMDPKLLDILVCPVCKGPLVYDRSGQELISIESALAYPIRDGIPVMLEDEARRLSPDEVEAWRAKR